MPCETRNAVNGPHVLTPQGFGVSGHKILSFRLTRLRCADRSPNTTSMSAHPHHSNPTTSSGHRAARNGLRSVILIVWWMSFPWRRASSSRVAFAATRSACHSTQPSHVYEGEVTAAMLTLSKRRLRCWTIRQLTRTKWTLGGVRCGGGASVSK
eukprot:1866894-Pleurochrysis_carterae.AAC.2